MKVNTILNESIGSEISRKMTGKLSGKEHARRTGLLALQRIVDGLSDKNFFHAFGDNPDGEIYGYTDDLRKEAIQAIKVLKSIEQ